MKTIEALHPWQLQAWGRVTQWIAQKRFPHALILSGPPGLGKHSFAFLLAASLVCQKPKTSLEACGQCRSCVQMIEDNYPDYTVIQPEEDSEVIKIDQLRPLKDWNAQSAHHEHYKIILIDPMEAMNTAAANSILKILEEPSDNRILLLITNNVHTILPTLLSRCQLLPFNAVHLSELTSFLSSKTESPELVAKLSWGAPLRALEMIKNKTLEKRAVILDGLFSLLSKPTNPIAIAHSLEDFELHLLLEVIQTILVDFQGLILVGAEFDLINMDQIPMLMSLSQQIEWPQLLRYMESIYQLKRSLSKKANFNALLQMEDLLIRWQALLGRV